jgi:hypothetical protein
MNIARFEIDFLEYFSLGFCQVRDHDLCCPTFRDDCQYQRQRLIWLS